MSNFFDQPGSILDSLINSGLVEDYGVAQKNPKRVAAAQQQHAQARRARRQAKEALAPPIDPPRRHRRPGHKPIGTRMYDRVLRVMEPGHWHPAGDLVRAAGYVLRARGNLMRSLLTGELVTRARNPGAASGTPTRPAPQWLYQLTPKGETVRELCKLLA
jgi:hypothetical protein